MWILLPLGSFALAVLSHGIVMRMPLCVDVVQRFMLVGIPIGGVLMAFCFDQFGLTTYALAGIFLYALLSELYMFFFTLVLSSVSATMLIMLRRGPIRRSAFASAYDPPEMMKLRLERLVRNGFIAREAGRLAVTSKGKRLHGAFSALRRFFGHESL